MQDEQQASVTLTAKAYQSLYQNYLHMNANSDGKNVVDVSLYIKSQDEETRQKINYFTLVVRTIRQFNSDVSLLLMENTTHFLIQGTL